MNPELKATTTAPAQDADPTASMAALPLWLVVLMLALLFGAALNFDFRGGWFEPKVYGPYTSIANVANYQPRTGSDTDRAVARGKVVFDATCALCHNPDGMGKPGQAPPLAGSEWVNANGANRLIRIPLLGLNGPIEVKGQPYNFSSGMTPFGSFPDEDIAAVLTYIRASFGNKASPVTVEQVKKVRAELGNRSQQNTVDELKGLPE
jgi:mono/diheme cytochrome c family protein